MVNLIGKQRSFLTHARIITANIIWFTHKFMTDRDISVPRSFLWGGGGLTQKLYIIYVTNYVMKIVSESPSWHLVRLQGKLK
jgi:hypothetical protein